MSPSDEKYCHTLEGNAAGARVVVDVDAGTLLDTVTPLDAGTLRGTEAVAQRRGQDGLSPSVDVMATRRTDGEELELDIHRRFLESVMAKGGDTHCCNELA